MEKVIINENCYIEIKPSDGVKVYILYINGNMFDSAYIEKDTVYDNNPRKWAFDRIKDFKDVLDREIERKVKKEVEFSKVLEKCINAITHFYLYEMVEGSPLLD